MPLAGFAAVIVSLQATGLLAVCYAVAVGLWWARRLWELVRSPVPASGHAG